MSLDEITQWLRYYVPEDTFKVDPQSLDYYESLGIEPLHGILLEALHSAYPQGERRKVVVDSYFQYKTTMDKLCKYNSYGDLLTVSGVRTMEYCELFCNSR